MTLLQMLLQMLLEVGLGMLLGVLGGVFGIGGGLLAIPALGLLGLDQQLAQGTALVMVVPNVMLALWRYHQRNRIDWRHGLLLGLSSLLLAWGGARFAVGLDAGAMRLAFVAFLLALALWNGLQLWLQPTTAAPKRLPSAGLVLLGGGCGLLGGLFGVGGAVLATPILTLLFGLSQVVAQGLALALALPGTLVTLLTYAGHGQVDWASGLPLALGGLLSISWGVRLAHRLPARRLRAWFALFLVGCALLLALKG